MSALSYANRHDDRYYLHAGWTRTGKPRYFVAKTLGQGTLDAMPEGYEFAESINGVVSVRRIDQRGPHVANDRSARLTATARSLSDLVEIARRSVPLH